VLDMEIRSPKALGGANDDFANPEMLFAAGYAACFDSALNGVMRQEKVRKTTQVTAEVGIGALETGGYGLCVDLQVNISDIDLEEAKKFVEKAHQVCPYSNATRGNIEVKISVTNN
ncbi:Ohr family peroxiredoxin, partial [Mesomycoplasma ovipneumoniae]|uniref:Ohr family peroxiredoxin n=1 Tax=Mesomycoplasma ovipneumoniae TaxID=29562 RepID=UPI0031194AA1